MSAVADVDVAINFKNLWGWCISCCILDSYVMLQVHDIIIVLDV